jgi:hypothetical protein
LNNLKYSRKFLLLFALLLFSGIFQRSYAQAPYIIAGDTIGASVYYSGTINAYVNPAIDFQFQGDSGYAFRFQQYNNITSLANELHFEVLSGGNGKTEMTTNNFWQAYCVADTTAGGDTIKVDNPEFQYSVDSCNKANLFLSDYVFDPGITLTQGWYGPGSGAGPVLILAFLHETQSDTCLGWFRIRGYDFRIVDYACTCPDLVYQTGVVALDDPRTDSPSPNINFFQGPAGGHIEVLFPGPKRQEVELSLHELSGRQVFSSDSRSGTGLVRWDLPSLSPAVYIARLKINEKMFWQKLAVQRW